VQAEELHRTNGIGFEAVFLIASFPMCIDKFLRSKVQNRFIDIFFHIKLMFADLRKLPAESVKE